MAKGAEPLTKDERRIKAADRMEPVDHQARHRVIVTGETIRAGEVMRIVQSPLDRYQKRKLITLRQHRAGAKLADAYQLGIVGARDPEAKGGSGVKVGLSEAQIMAAESYRMATLAIGPRLSSIVVAVCCDERTVEEIAEVREIDRKGLMAVFRVGLDHLGDHYGDDPEIIQEIVKTEPVTALVRGKPVQRNRDTILTYRHEADGTVSGIQLGNRLWHASAGSIGELKKLARENLG